MNNGLVLQIIDGYDKGKVLNFDHLPVTIGRDPTCQVRVNDDRVSRLHARILQDRGRIVLTDLDSTNGTFVNGQPITLRILDYGDQIMCGHTVMVHGSSVQINRAASSKDALPAEGASCEQSADELAPDERPPDSGEAPGTDQDMPVDQDIPVSDPPSAMPGPSSSGPVLWDGKQPRVMYELSPAQAAELLGIFEQLHGRLGGVSKQVLPADDERNVVISFEGWQEILAVQMKVAQYINALGRGES